MDLKVKRYYHTYEGKWDECSLDEVYADDFVFILDGNNIELSDLLKLLLKNNKVKKKIFDKKETTYDLDDLVWPKNVSNKMEE